MRGARLKGSAHIPEVCTNNANQGGESRHPVISMQYIRQPAITDADSDW